MEMSILVKDTCSAPCIIIQGRHAVVFFTLVVSELHELVNIRLGDVNFAQLYGNVSVVGKCKIG